MNLLKSISVASLLAYASFVSGAEPEPQVIRTIDGLGDSRGYCLDIVGLGAMIRLDDPIVAHTCKAGLMHNDEHFIALGTDDIQLRAPSYDVCLTADEMKAGMPIRTKSCSDIDEQRWHLHEDGSIRAAEDSGLCISVSLTDAPTVLATPAMEKLHQFRKVLIDTCNEAVEPRQQWMFSDAIRVTREPAYSRPGIMPEQIADLIQAIGIEPEPERRKKTLRAYADLDTLYELSDILTEENISYGPDAGQQLDVHTHKRRRSDFFSNPILVFLPDIEFSGGDRLVRRNVADYFASIGFTSITAGYRSTSKDGVDIDLLLSWTAENIGEYHGDPNRVFLLAESSAVTVVANYLSALDLPLKSSNQIKAAIMVSEPNLPASIEASSIPVQAYPKFSGHNLISPMSSIGTIDTSISSKMLEFIQSVPE